MKGFEKERADILMVLRGLVDSREKAKRLIMAGKVKVNGERVTKPSQLLPLSSTLELIEEPRFVSRGGDKLDGFLEKLEEMGFSVKGLKALDIGASTGGFTDCLLQRGVRKVFALDVGRGQLSWKLRNDERVVVIEGFNARHLDYPSYKRLVGEQVDLVTVDVSFISSVLILEALNRTFIEGIALNELERFPAIILLIKPQFELSPSLVKGGVVKTTELILEAVRKVLVAAMKLGFIPWALEPSKVRGFKKGNQEVFALLLRNPREGDISEEVDVLLASLSKKLRERKSI